MYLILRVAHEKKYIVYKLNVINIIMVPSIGT